MLSLFYELEAFHNIISLKLAVGEDRDNSLFPLPPPRQNIIPNPHSHKNPNFEPLKNRRIRQLDVGHLNHALSFLDLMTLQNAPPDLTTYSILLKSCIRFRNFQLRKLVHRKLIQSGLELDSVVLNTLISLYSKCGDTATASGDLGSGYKVFEKMPERNLGTWTLMITRFAQLGCARDAIELFLDMELSGHALDRFTYSSVLSASTESGLLALGKQLHSQVIRLGLASDVCVGCSLVDMYAKCTADGSADDLRKVFDRMPEHNVILDRNYHSICANWRL
ncbi:hypothetical protein AAG906_012897 [Vitis piasezkii]